MRVKFNDLKNNADKILQEINQNLYDGIPVRCFLSTE